MAEFVLGFEKPIIELEKKIIEMKAYAVEENVELAEEVKRLEAKLKKLMKDTYSKLTRWQRYQLAKHPDRPFSKGYIDRIFTDFVELHGDRLFGDDQALIGGLSKLDGMSVMVMGQQKGRTIKEKHGAVHCVCGLQAVQAKSRCRNGGFAFGPHHCERKGISRHTQ